MYLGEGLLNHTVCIYLSLLGNPNYIPKWFYQFTLWPAVDERFYFFTSVTTFGIVRFETFCLSVESYCGIIYIYLIPNEVVSFHMIIDYFGFLFIKCLFKSFVHFSLELFVFYLMILKYYLHFSSNLRWHWLENVLLFYITLRKRTLSVKL